MTREKLISRPAQMAKPQSAPFARHFSEKNWDGPSLKQHHLSSLAARHRRPKMPLHNGDTSRIFPDNPAEFEPSDHMSDIPE